MRKIIVLNYEEDSMSGEYHHCKLTREFETHREYVAFLDGMECAQGWPENEIFAKDSEHENEADCDARIAELESTEE